MKKSKILLTVCLLAILGTVRYITLNKKYPNPAEHIARAGEELNIGNYTFELKDWKWSDGRIIDEILPGYKILTYSNGEAYPIEKEKVALATVEISKIAEDDTYLDLRNIAFEMGAWHNQWDAELFDKLNGDNGLILDLERGEKKEAVFPIVLYDFQFRKKDWEVVETKKINMVITCYPEKYVLQGGTV